MNTRTELLLDYQEMAILALREEIVKLKIERNNLQTELLTLKLKNNE